MTFDLQRKKARGIVLTICILSALVLPTQSTMSIPSHGKAVTAAGGSLALEDRAVAAPKKGEVLLQILTSAINRADTLQAAGKYPR